jgi:hypothetical protein
MTLVDMRLQTAGLDRARRQLGGTFDARPAPVLRLTGEPDAGPMQLSCAQEDGAPLWQAEAATVVAAIPCFTPGTQLASQRGMIAVEDLCPGDQLVTRDNGMQSLLWSGQRRFDWRMLGMNPLLRPVRIAAGALAPGLPLRDMLVSPNHRMLTRTPEAGRDEGGERLIEARALIGQPGITRSCDSAICYVQLLFGRHELLLGEGVWSESFQPDTCRLLALGEAGLADFIAKNPDLKPEDGGDPEAVYAAARPQMETIADWDRDRQADHSADRNDTADGDDTADGAAA